MSKVLTSAVIAFVLILVGATQVPATSDATMSRPTPTFGSPSVEAYVGTATASRQSMIASLMKTKKIGLTAGKYVSIQGTTTREGKTVLGTNDTSSQWLTAGSSPAMTLTYQIVLLGAPTPYWVRATETVYEQGGYTNGCDIYLGDPVSGGTVVSSDSPYVCDVNGGRAQSNGTAFVDFTVSDNVAAEVQGVIKPVGSVSLDEGYYELNTAHAVLGSTKVAKSDSTRWDSILRDGDTPVEPNLARGIFVYRIVNDGKGTPFWVKGLAENYRGTSFGHTSTCEIYDVNPTEGGGPGGAPNPLSVSPFDCTMSSQNVEHRGNWEVTFTISARKMAVVTGKFQQAELIEKVCAHDNGVNCGVSLASVKKIMGPGKQASDKVNNPGILPTQNSQSASRTIGTTTTVGTKVAVEKGVTGVFKVSVEISLDVAITDSTTYTKTETLTVAPNTRGWWDMAPELIEASGDIIVRDGDRYYDLPAVDATFPEKDGHSDLTARCEELSNPNTKCTAPPQAPMVTPSPTTSLAPVTPTPTPGQLGPSPAAIVTPTPAQGQVFRGRLSKVEPRVS